MRKRPWRTQASTIPNGTGRVSTAGVPSSRWCWRTLARLSVEHREERVEALRQQRVGEDRVGHRGIRELAEHGDLDDAHDLAAFDAEDGAAQDLPAAGVDDGLHEAARLPRLDGPDDPAHRQLPHPDLASLRSCRALGQAGP